MTAQTQTPPDIEPLLQSVLAILAAVNKQTTPSQNPANPASPQDVLQKMISVLDAASGVAAAPGDTTTGGATIGGAATGGAAKLPLGPVNGALGQGIGNLLNGSKSMIGILGALASQLVQIAGTPAAGAAASSLSPLLTSIAGATPYATPIFLALAAWGVLGKMEKWAQAQTPATQPAASK